MLELQKRHNCHYVCPTTFNEGKDPKKYGHLTKVIQSPFLRYLGDWAASLGWMWLKANIEINRYCLPEIIDGDFNYLFVHDLTLLPHFVHFTKSKVIFDAREFYPLEFSDDPYWHRNQGRLAKYMCKRYMPKAYKVLTVSPSIVKLYERLLGRKVELFPSYPREELLESQRKKTYQKPIRFIHHGGALANRGLEKMIELMEVLGEDYQLDMMLVPGPGGKYLKQLKKRAKNVSNVRFVTPVHPDKIISTCTRYDVGLYLMSVNESQNRYCLPNKFFEFLYAGLPLITSFSEDMRGYVERYSLGLGFGDESVEKIACEIRQLRPQDLARFRQNIQANVSKWSVRENVATALPELA